MIRSFSTTVSRIFSCPGFLLQNNIKKMRDLSELRISYNPEVVMDPSNLPTSDPMELFSLWFDEAQKCEGIIEPNQMTLATATKGGFPSARFVLLKGIDNNGFRFFTNYNSRKGKEIEENKNVALVFYWEPLSKQVRVEGTAEKLSPVESDAYFHSRPRGSQISAVLSEQSTIIESRHVLTEKYQDLEAKYSDESISIERPKHWGGFKVIPKAIEFWQGQQDRLHNRVRFEKMKSESEEKLWHSVLLSP